MQGVVGILRSCSLPVASAVVEIAAIADWLDGGDAKDSMSLFNKSDLMVLSYGQGKAHDGDDLDRDLIMSEYAEALFGRGTLDTARSSFDVNMQATNEVQEGWEIGVQIFARLQQADTMSERMGRLLDELPLESNERVDKLLSICNEADLGDQARKIAEVS